MIQHTMIVSFDDALPDTELDEFLADIDQVMQATGNVVSSSARHHIAVPADEHGPVFTASAILQFSLTDLDALNDSFAAPGVYELIQRWQARHPYRVVWANHKPLS